jgi:hypothetical protein
MSKINFLDLFLHLERHIDARFLSYQLLEMTVDERKIECYI